MSGKGAEIGNKRREGKSLRRPREPRTTLTVEKFTLARVGRIHDHLHEVAFDPERRERIPADVRARFFGRALSRANVVDVALELLERSLGLSSPDQKGKP